MPRRIINPLPPPAPPPTRIAARTRDRYEDIHRLLDQGYSVSAVARRLHLDRKTVRRFRDTDIDELLASARHGRPKRVLEPFTAYLTERFTDGVTSPTDLFREIRQRGYQGSDLPVRRYVAGLRIGTVEPAQGAIPSPRKITTWIMVPHGAHNLLQHRCGHQLLEWVLRAGPVPRPGGCHCRPHPSVELWHRRRSRQSNQDHQTNHVRSGLVPTPADPHPHSTMTWRQNRLVSRHNARYVHLVCYYAENPYKLHYACVPCRVAFKRHPGHGEHKCPRCSEPMACAGHDFAAPRHRDTKAWTVVAAVLNAGLRYEGRELCGCGKEPKFRPRTRAQVRARRIAATRTGIPLADLLGYADPQASA